MERWDWERRAQIEIPAMSLAPGQKVLLPLPWWWRWWNRLKSWVLNRQWAEIAMYRTKDGRFIEYHNDGQIITIAALEEGEDGTWG